MAHAPVSKVFSSLCCAALLTSCRPPSEGSGEHLVPRSLNGAGAASLSLPADEVVKAPSEPSDESFEGIVQYLASDKQQGRFPFNLAQAKDKALLGEWLSEVGLAQAASLVFGLPHPTSEGHDRVRGFLVNWLQKENFTFAGDKQVYTQKMPVGENILGIYYPPGTEGKRPQIILSSHYDHMGILCTQSGESLSPYCNGAADNAAGVAAAMHTFLQLKPHLQAPLALSFWDLEEYGLRGSRHFAQAPLFPLDDVRLIINFDTIGSALFGAISDIHFAVGAETGGKELTDDLKAAAAKVVGLDVKPLSSAVGHMRNDLSSFINLGHRIPSVLLTDGDGGAYHSTADEPMNINWSKAKKISAFAAEMALTALRRPKPYSFHSPLGWVIKRPLPVHSDCLVIAEVTRTLLEREQKVASLPPAVLEMIRGIHADMTLWSARSPYLFSLWHKKKFADHLQTLTALSRMKFADD